jgi:hypothetical protein
MSRWLLLLAFVVFTLSVGAQTNPATGKQETVEAVRTHWVEQFKGDPAGKVEVFHIGGKKTVIGQENYVIGLTEAAFETGHPIYFTQGTEDVPPGTTIAKPVKEVK